MVPVLAPRVTSTLPSCCPLPPLSRTDTAMPWKHIVFIIIHGCKIMTTE